MLKLILGVSKDGCLARSADDNMRWLGETDKSIFRILTAVGGKCVVSCRSYGQMPAMLPGRSIHLVSTKGRTLLQAANEFDGGWLLGGPTLASVALDEKLLSEVHICRSSRYAFPTSDPGLRMDNLSNRLPGLGFVCAIATKMQGVTVEAWRNQYVRS